MSDLEARLRLLLGDDVAALGRELGRNARAAAGAMAARLPFVPREEFDVQAALLARTRDRVDALADAVALLEGRLAADGGGSGSTGA